jgi:hypothetical protein
MHLPASQLLLDNRHAFRYYLSAKLRRLILSNPQVHGQLVNPRSSLLELHIKCKTNFESEIELGRLKECLKPFCVQLPSPEQQRALESLSQATIGPGGNTHQNDYIWSQKDGFSIRVRRGGIDGVECLVFWDNTANDDRKKLEAIVEEVLRKMRNGKLGPHTVSGSLLYKMIKLNLNDCSVKPAWGKMIWRVGKTWIPILGGILITLGIGALKVEDLLEKGDFVFSTSMAIIVGFIIVIELVYEIWKRNPKYKMEVSI